MENIITNSVQPMKWNETNKPERKNQTTGNQ